MTRTIRRRSPYAGNIRDWSISEQSDFKEPNINWVNFDRFNITIKNAYILDFNSHDEFLRFSATLGNLYNQLLFSRIYMHQFTFSKNLVFQGKLSFISAHNRQAYYQSGYTVRAQLELKLNLTRAIKHAYCTSGTSEHNLDRSTSTFDYVAYLDSQGPLEALEKDPHSSQEHLGLDDNDNVIADLNVFLNARPMSRLFRAHLDAILNIVDTAITESLQGTAHTYHAERLMTDWQVNNAEIYWEYRSPDALAMVTWLQKCLPRLFSESKVATYIYGDNGDARALQQRQGQQRPTAGEVLNCPMIKLGLGRKKVELAIYAKLIDRVRFEIRYNDNLKQIFRYRNNDDFETGFYRLLDSATHRAHGYLKRTFKHIRQDKTAVAKVNFNSFVWFLGTFAQTIASVETPGMFIRLFSIIIHNNAISVKNNSEEEHACRLLASQDILVLSKITRPRRGTKRYTLAPRYRRVIEAMNAVMPLHRPRRRNRAQ